MIYHLFDNNARKELSEATFSRWICTTLVDSHATLQESKSFPVSVKALKVRAVATSLQLFNKVDLHTVMKARRWSMGGTFTSFYLRDLCQQADHIWHAPSYYVQLCRPKCQIYEKTEYFEYATTVLKPNSFYLINLFGVNNVILQGKVKDKISNEARQRHITEKLRNFGTCMTCMTCI